MKLSQILHKFPQDQLVLIREYSTDNVPRPIIVKGRRTLIHKDSPLNDRQVKEVFSYQAFIIIGLAPLSHNKKE